MKFVTTRDSTRAMPDASPVEINPPLATRKSHVRLTTRSILTTTLRAVTTCSSNSATRVGYYPLERETAKSNLNYRHRL